MFNRNKKSLITACVAALTFLAIGNGAAYAEAAKIGFVYVSPLGDAGWTYQHNLGRLHMQKSLGDKVDSKYVENVPEGPDAERVIREMAQNGYKAIFTTSFGYMNPTEKVSKQFPKIAFLHATGYKSGANFANYNARFYEGRYLNGIVAGSMTKSNILGYVAAFPIPEVLQGINAFTRGARSVNPKAEVRVVWVNSWHDPGKEREAALSLIAQNADVVTHHTDSTAVVQAAEEKNAWAVSYHSDMSKFAPRRQLTGTVHIWNDFYTKTVEDVLAGTWKPTNLWGGIKDGMITTAPLNPAVPKNVREMVAKAEAGIKAGTLHPFTGPIKNQGGTEILAAGVVMTDAQLNKMDYYVEGISGTLPKK